MKNYQDIIKENDNKGKFNDAGTLIDFINDYSQNGDSIDEIKELEDNISEYVDGLCPIYYYDIVKQWQENSEAQQMTVEICGSYDGIEDIYKMMSSDLFFYYEQQLREDYQTLLDLMEEEEEEETNK